MSDTLCDIKWQRVAISANFSFFWIRAEPTSGHPKENSLNIEEDFEEGYWIKSRNKPLGRNINSKTQEFQRQLFDDFLQNRCLEHFAIFPGKHLCCCVGVSFNKIAGLQACHWAKSHLSQVLEYPRKLKKTT